MKLVRFSAPSQGPVWLNVDMICTVQRCRGSPAGCRSEIHHAGGVQYVQEAPEAVATALQATVQPAAAEEVAP